LEKIELKAKTRTAKGNGPARALRREGRMPAVLYGPDTEPLMLSIDMYDVDMVLKQGNISRAVIDLAIDDGKTKKSAMVKEFQIHPVSQEFVHMDLYEIAMDRKIRVNVPVVPTGKSKGVELGGMLQIIRRELEVFCLPNAIPEAFNVDITDLDMGDAIHVEDIPIEGDVEIPHEVNFTVLTVVSPKVEAEAEEGEEEEALEEGEEAEGEAEAESSE
jgi:large subunit ribosomal protein L25